MFDLISAGYNIMKYAPQIKSGWDWLTGKRGPSRSGSISKYEKNYIAGLKQQAKTGMTQAQVNQTMGLTTRAMGTETEIAKTNVMGNAVNTGLEDSGVVAEQMMDVDLAGSAEVAATARKVAEDNIAMQESAESKLGAYGIQRTNQNYNEALRHYANQENRMGSVMNTISQFGSEYLGGLKNKADLEKLKSTDWWEKLSPEEKARILYPDGFPTPTGGL